MIQYLHEQTGGFKMETKSVNLPTRNCVGFIVSGMGRPQRKDFPSTQPDNFFYRGRDGNI